jgi:hypothetical protein
MLICSVIIMAASVRRWVVVLTGKISAAELAAAQL